MAGRPCLTLPLVTGLRPGSVQFQEEFYVVPTVRHQSLMYPTDGHPGRRVPLGVPAQKTAVDLQAHHGNQRRHLHRTGKAVGHEHQIGNIGLLAKEAELQPMIGQISALVQRTHGRQCARRTL